jgi:hypothetical protein
MRCPATTGVRKAPYLRISMSEPEAALFRGRGFVVRHLARLAQFIERHALEDGSAALLCTSTTGLAHQLVGDGVVGDRSACHSVLSRVVIQ